ncbi:Lrp/AsnC family transcriptional regulator [Sediminivirga luteola]|jgi:Lrp/AsnC family leucine-responsive transcriptional regulator|uniref:Lrp/AsnC family transcriptional regulator n=1 Tax=Sediminivirga luteola TaxID=1774748 RepID=UPI001F5A55C8|nr:Lrp/AsnC family transcriptional regulator [Sediminivirga luteola]MCI2264697.1 Lrp/AsnC family transcriptional regulator [Sediminivirga luteola]
MDVLDERIVEYLRHDARTPVTKIARSIGLSNAATGRRIARLEQDGVIQGYVAVVSPASTRTLEAFAEIRLGGETSGDRMAQIAALIPEISEYFVVAGDPDVLTRFTVDNVEHLHSVINRIRRQENVVGTKTLIVISAWNRALASR